MTREFYNGSTSEIRENDSKRKDLDKQSQNKTDQEKTQLERLTHNLTTFGESKTVTGTEGMTSSRSINDEDEEENQENMEELINFQLS